MQLDRIDLNHLVVLDALLAECSVTRAAERVCLSQPATSCALARLRSFFGDRLLVQVGRTMVLTPAAEKMIIPLRELLAQVDVVASSRPRFDPATVSRTLQIESSDYVISVLLAQVINECAEIAPDLRFELGLNNARSRDRLERGEIDFLIASDCSISPKHAVVPLFQDTFSCLAWSGNQKIGEQISMRNFFELGHVATDWSGGLLTTVEDAIFGGAGQKRRCEVSVSHYTMIPKFVVGTERIATLQTRLAQRVAAVAPLRVLKCPAKVPVFEEVLQFHRFQERDPTIAWFVEQVKAAAVSIPGLAAPNAKFVESDVPVSSRRRFALRQSETIAS